MKLEHSKIDTAMRTLKAWIPAAFIIVFGNAAMLGIAALIAAASPAKAEITWIGGYIPVTDYYEVQAVAHRVPFDRSALYYTKEPWLEYAVTCKPGYERVTQVLPGGAALCGKIASR